MNYVGIRAGDEIQVGALVGHRVWRYRLGPPLVLLSFCLGDRCEWPPLDPYEADKEPNMDGRQMAHGVHAFKTLAGLQAYFRDLPDLLRYRNIYDGAAADLMAARYDGVVRGTVRLWGVCVEHERGWRGQYARPASFDEIHGERADEALGRLRRLFGLIR